MAVEDARAIRTLTCRSGWLTRWSDRVNGGALNALGAWYGTAYRVARWKKHSVRLHLLQLLHQEHLSRFWPSGDFATNLLATFLNHPFALPQFAYPFRPLSFHRIAE
jgi:hypothetical protein